MKTPQSTDFGLEPISPSQRMIGILLATKGAEGDPLFSYESLAERMLDSEGGKAAEAEANALAEQLRRIQNGEVTRTRPSTALYQVFHDEISGEYVEGW